MDEVDELLRVALADDRVVGGSVRVRYSDALEHALGVDAGASPARLGAKLAERGIDVPRGLEFPPTASAVASRASTSLMSLCSSQPTRYHSSSVNSG